MTRQETHLLERGRAAEPAAWRLEDYSQSTQMFRAALSFLLHWEQRFMYFHFGAETLEDLSSASLFFLCVFPSTPLYWELAKALWISHVQSLKELIRLVCPLSLLPGMRPFHRSLASYWLAMCECSSVYQLWPGRVGSCSIGQGHPSSRSAWGCFL